MKKLVLNKKFLGSVLTIYLPCFILFASPYVAWTGNYGRQAISASGDYPFIFLINPISFIQHVAFHVFQSNAGAESLLPYLSMAVFATPFKIIGLNPQLVIVGLLLSATYLGMVLFVQEFMKDKDDFPAVGMLAGTVAVFAPLISQNVFYYFSPSMVLIPFVPWFCLTLKKYCDSGNSKYIYFSSLQIFMASAGLTDIPDALPTIFLVVMLSMFIFMHEKKLNVLTLSRVFDLVILSIFINLFWILPWLLTFTKNSIQITTATSLSGKIQCTQYVSVLSQYSSIFDSLSLKNSVPFMTNFNLPQLAYSEWFSTISFLGFIPILFIISAWFFDAFGKSQSITTRIPFYGMLATSLFFTGMISLGSLPMTLSMFNWCVYHIPGWVTQRTFYKTFEIPLVLAIATTCGLASILFSYRLKKKTFTFLITSCSLCFASFGLPLLTGESFRLPVSTGNEANRLITGLPSGYVKIADYLSSHGAQSVVSFPLLNSGSMWTYLSAVTPNKNYYLGVSPLRNIYGINNYVSSISFASTTNNRIQDLVYKSINSGDASQLAEIIQNTHIEYVLTNVQSMNSPVVRSMSQIKSSAKEEEFYSTVLKKLSVTSVMSIEGYKLYKLKFQSLNNGSTSPRNFNYDKVNFVYLSISIFTLAFLIVSSVRNRRASPLKIRK